MNKLKSQTGGMPLEIDDFEWISNGIIEAIKGTLYGQNSNGNFILSGCDISYSAGNATITEGFVCLNWEVCYCPSHTVAVTSLAASSLKVLETYDASGAEVFADSITRDTYAIRRARISDGLNSGTEIVLNYPVRIQQLCTVDSSYDSNYPVQYSGSWSAASGTPKVGRQGKTAWIRGVFEGGDWEEPILLLPYWAFPAARMMFTAIVDETTTALISIAVDGTVYLHGSGTTPTSVEINVVFPLV